MKIEYEERVSKLNKITTQYRNIFENAEGKTCPIVVSEERSSKTQIRHIDLG